jgi:hypothetical protein
MPTYVTFVDLKNQDWIHNALHKIPNSLLRRLLSLLVIGLQITFHENKNASDATAKFRFQQHNDVQYRFITKSVKKVCTSI